METTMSKRIRRLRKDQKLTQQQLAHETGLSISAIKSYENGIREPNSKAMAALEQYFNVSGGYLRGDTDIAVYKWENRKIMNAVNDSFYPLFADLTDLIHAGDECTQKMAFDILVELRHILSMNTEQKPDAMILLQETFSITTRFVDVYIRSTFSGTGDARIEKMKQSCTKDFITALETFSNE